MTNIYFVRHAQPEYSCADASLRPLTAEGVRDTAEVVRTMKDIRLDYAISSPYKRSYDTIKQTADEHGLTIDIDERLHERISGKDSNNAEMFRRRWEDLSFCESDGESIGSVMERNMAAVNDILDKHEGENIIVGTHGTALSSILHYYDNSFGLDGFLRIIDFMPYIVRLGFEGRKCVEKEELLIVKKEFKNGNNR
ncbi:histidine phosphatase family protein [Ruminococcus flavefaciens]|uniref:histidine phosphatase family protein n=1 Tax=Ruminococcus flavefaciens TaxID=1265 RepID=UPI0026F3120D|nr:histidine phosphatase family protein [Ruminococcus flavefaciens]MDD7516805.1 histidine phosphatase family protein [Ruminococcus flavefaciens]MDY5692010.1 histidine phosphatase family protein [Ruminococcus flavefaciens]